MSYRKIIFCWMLMAPLFVACSQGADFLPTAEPSLPAAEPSPTASPTLEIAHTGTPDDPGLLPVPTLTGLHLFTPDSPPSEISFRLPITLRHVEPDRAYFSFELDRAAPAALVVREVGSATDGRLLELPADTPRQLIEVTGLEPGTAYEALLGVTDGSGELERPGYGEGSWPVISFQTPDGGPLRIAIIGDSGFGGAETYQLAERMALHEPDFVLHTGDVVYRMHEEGDPYRSYARKFYRPFEPLLRQGPIYTVPGNHEYDAAARWEEAPFYDAAFPLFMESPLLRSRPQYYAFAYGDVQFIMLDSQVFYGVSGREEQEAWLDERLRDVGFRLHVLVFHIAPFTSSSVHPGDGRPLQAAWHPKFAASGSLIVFNGHSHLYERLLIDGVMYVTSGGGSGSLYRAGSLAAGSQALASETHFVLLELESDSYRLRAIGLDGSILDEVFGAVP